MRGMGPDEAHCLRHQPVLVRPDFGGARRNRQRAYRALDCAIPVIGSLLVGLMARFGSEKIKGTWHSRSDRGHPLRRKPPVAQGRDPQATFLGNLDRQRRTIRRRRSDHHDRGRDRLAICAMLQAQRCRAQDAARCRCGSGHDRDIRDTARGDPAGDRGAAVRMEAA